MTRVIARRLWTLGCVLLTVLVLGACGEPEPVSQPESDPAEEWFDACPQPVSPVPSTASPPAPAGESEVGELPDLTLPCLGPGEDVSFGEPLGVPLLINLWASWCAPCRDELPTLARYAERTRGQVVVLGIVTQDRRESAVALARDLDVRFPAVYDEQGRFNASLGRRPLPATLFVAPSGQVLHLYNDTPLDDAGLAALSERYFGV